MKPIVKWSGGKGDEISKIIPHLPANYDTYIEPFIGGGALYFHLKPKKAVITDVHKELISFYKSIKDERSQDIYDFMKAHPNEEKMYYDVRKSVPTTQFEEACRFFYLRKTCFRGMMRYNKSGGFNVPYGRYKTFNYENLKEQGYTELLNRTTVERQDFNWAFDNYDDENNFMFLDPPYDSPFSDYGYCTFDRNKQIELANRFKNTNIKCLMIIGETDFIKDLYNGYVVGSYPKKYRFKLHSNRIGNEINTNHLIIKNY